MPQVRNPELVENLRGEFSSLDHTHGVNLNIFLSLSGSVGFWPMSSVQRSTGNAYDLSGQGRTLTYNGNPTYNIYNDIVSYLDLDGTGDYLSRTDETDLDILGTETIYNSSVRGLTIGGWFYNNANFAAGGTGLIGKYNFNAGSNGSYLLYGTTTTPTMLVTNGTTNTTRTSSVTVSTGEWWFGVGRYTPSSVLDIFVGKSSGLTKTTNSTSIPASINNTTVPLEIGAFNVANNFYTGRVSLCFLCANALPDALISSIFQHTRKAFGI